MGAMDQELFIHWNETSGFKSIEADLKDDHDIIFVWGTGRKGELNQMPYYTMIGGDALHALKRYVNEARKRIIDRKFGGDPEKATAIFYSRHGHPVTKRTMTQYYHKKLVQLGLIELIKDEHGKGHPGNRYGKNVHEFRDTWRTHATSFRLEEKIPETMFEFCMGHVTGMDKNKYDKYCKNQVAMKILYRRALPYYNLMTSNKALSLYDEEDLEREREIERVKASQRSKTISESPGLSALQDQLDNLADMQYQKTV